MRVWNYRSCLVVSNCICSQENWKILNANVVQSMRVWFGMYSIITCNKKAKLFAVTIRIDQKIKRTIFRNLQTWKQTTNLDLHHVDCSVNKIQAVVGLLNKLLKTCFEATLRPYITDYNHCPHKCIYLIEANMWLMKSQALTRCTLA